MGDGSGLVDPEMIPKIDTSYVTAAATDLRNMGDSVNDNTDAMVSAWAGLQVAGVYESPESSTVYTLLDPASTAADDVKSALDSAATAMDDFADELDGIKPELDQLRTDAEEFRTRALKGVDVPKSTYCGPYSLPQSTATEHKEWYDSPGLCEENNHLVSRINDQVAKIVNAENACANTLHGLIPGQCFEQRPTNVTGESLDAVEGGMPWGGRREYEPKNCGESAVAGVADGIGGLLEGGASLISYNPRTGEWGDWSHAGQAWAGLGNLGLSLVVVANPLFTPVATTMSLAGVDNSFTRFVQDRQMTVASTVAGIVNIDLTAEDPFAAWKKDGVRAAFGSVTNIGTFFIPGADAGSVLKVGAEGAEAASKGGRLAGLALRTVGTVADTIIPGGSFAVKFLGEGGVKAVDFASRGGEAASIAAHAPTAISNSLIHEAGRAEGVPGGDAGLGHAGAHGIDAPSVADAGSVEHGLDGLGDSVGRPGPSGVSDGGVPDLGGSGRTHGADAPAAGRGPSGDGSEGGSTAGRGPQFDSSAADSADAGHPDAEPPRTSTPETTPYGEGGGPAVVGSDAAEPGAAEAGPSAESGAGGGHGDGAGSRDGGTHADSPDGDAPARRGDTDSSPADAGGVDEARHGETDGQHGDHGGNDGRHDSSGHDESGHDGHDEPADRDGRGGAATHDGSADGGSDSPRHAGQGDGSGEHGEASAGHDGARSDGSAGSDDGARHVADEGERNKAAWDTETDWPDRPDATISDGNVEVRHDGGQTVVKDSDGHVTVADAEASVKASPDGMQVHHVDGDFTVNERGELTSAPEGASVHKGEDGTWSVDTGGSDPVHISRDADGVVTVQHGDTTVRQLDGTTLADASDGLYTKVHADGTTQITQVGSDGSCTTLFEDGTTLHRYPDGGFDIYGDPKLAHDSKRGYDGTVDPSPPEGLSESGLTNNGKLKDPSSVPPEIQSLVDKGVVSIDDKGVVRVNQKVTESFSLPETAESYRQAGLQERGMNDLTQNIREDNMEARSKDKGWGKSDITRYRREAEQHLTDSFEQQGLPKDEAQSRAKKTLFRHEALHGPDRVIGGNPDNFTGFGKDTTPGNTVNSAMGRHWSNRTVVDNFNERITESMVKIPKNLRGDVRVNVDFRVNGKTANFTGLP